MNAARYLSQKTLIDGNVNFSVHENCRIYFPKKHLSAAMPTSQSKIPFTKTLMNRNVNFSVHENCRISFTKTFISGNVNFTVHEHCKIPF